ncbi:MAG: hypothetical protein CK535_01700 [Pelagibacteraceae bacterium]|nr:MAG: hypothetical protein CK535_01700 [Pelagibacteraceae bacterium]
MEKWRIARIIKIMLQDRHLNKLRKLPEPVRQLAGLVIIIIIVILSFAILNIFFGHDKDLVAKMKKEEEKNAEKRKLSEMMSNLPSGILVTYDGTDNYKLSEELYEKVCNATKLIPQRTLLGANLINLKAHQIYTNNGNQIQETFVKWDSENKKCVAGYVLKGTIDGKEETITVSGDALSFLSTGIDTRVYFIKNF